MSKNTNWLLLILLVFTGQTFAAPFTNYNNCEMNHSSSVTSDHAMTNHDMDSMSDHDMSSMDMSSNMTMDCCADDCQCSDGMCTSNVYLSIHERNMEISIENNVSFRVIPFKTIQRHSSLYRPPILS